MPTKEQKMQEAVTQRVNVDSILNNPTDFFKPESWNHFMRLPVPDSRIKALAFQLARSGDAHQMKAVFCAIEQGLMDNEAASNLLRVLATAIMQEQAPNPDFWRPLADDSSNEQTQFIASLLFYGPDSEINTFARLTNETLGNSELDAALGKKLQSGIYARMNICRMISGDVDANFFLSEAFNPAIHRRYPMFNRLMNASQRHRMLERVIQSCAQEHMGQLAQLFINQGAFGAKCLNEFQGMLALLKAQDIATSENAAKMIAGHDFNPGLVVQFRLAFMNQICDKQEVILANLDVSELSLEQERRLQNNLRQMNWGGAGSGFITQMSEKVGALLEQKRTVSEAAKLASRRSGFMPEPEPSSERECTVSCPSCTLL